MSAGNKKQSWSLTTPQTHSTLCLALTPWYKRHLLQNPMDTTNQWRHWPSVSHVLWPTHEFLKLTKHNRFLNFGHCLAGLSKSSTSSHCIFWRRWLYIPNLNQKIMLPVTFPTFPPPTFVALHQTSQREVKPSPNRPRFGTGKNASVKVGCSFWASHHWRSHSIIIWKPVGTRLEIYQLVGPGIFSCKKSHENKHFVI